MIYNLRYNLQFFAEENDSDENESNEQENNDEVDIQALANLVTERDKKIDDLESEITKLKKANAQMIVQIKASNENNKVDVDQAILDFCDVRKVGQPTNRKE